MSVRQDALRRQYEARAAGGGGVPAPAPRGFDGNGRPLPRVRPRNRFWRWFWLIFLLTLLGGFLHGRKSFTKWFEHMHGDGPETTAAERAH